MQKSSAGLTCSKEFKGGYTTNLKKKYLKACHTDAHKQFEGVKLKRQVTKILLVPICSSGSKSYDHNSKKHKDITFHLATFIGANNVPLNLVDNSEFRELIEELDPQYSLPHQYKMGNEIEKNLSKFHI